MCWIFPGILKHFLNRTEGRIQGKWQPRLLQISLGSQTVLTRSLTLNT